MNKDTEILYNSSQDSAAAGNEISNYSSLSCLSNYEYEYLQLQNLVCPSPSKQLPIERSLSDDVHSVCNERIKNLSAELRNALKQNEKLKNDLFNAEKKAALLFYDKIDQLIKTNAHFKLQLDTAYKQIERLIGEQEPAKAKNNEHNFNLSIANLRFQSELYELKCQQETLMNEKNTLCMELNELRPLLLVKEACVKDLKGKVSQQHVEFQRVFQENLRLLNSAAALKSELERYKKSGEWYKQQLQVYQRQKQELLDANIILRKNILVQNQKITNFNSELTQMKCKHEDLERKLLEKSEEYNKKVRTIEKQTERSRFDDSMRNHQTIRSETQRSIFVYEKIIRELSEEIKQVRSNVAVQQDAFSAVSNENGKLISQCISLQKIMQQKESDIESLESTLKSLKMHLTVSSNKRLEQFLELVKLKDNLVKYKVELDNRNKEKIMVESTITTIKGQFNVLKCNYEKLIKELNEKNQQILNLEVEKQELFMSNNWKVCELEKMKETDGIVINLNKTIEQMKTEKCELLELKNKENSKLRSELRDLQISVANLTELLLNSKAKLDTEVSKRETTIKNIQKCMVENEAEAEKLRSIISEDKVLLNNEKAKVDLLQKALIKREQELSNMKLVDSNVTDDFKQKFKNRKRNLRIIIKHLDLLEDRSRCVFTKSQNSVLLIETLIFDLKFTRKNYVDNINHVKAQLKVKDLEIKEKQKRYEKNYRTLLKAVKEHMKRRNLAEKNYSYLQALIDSFSEEIIALKLHVISKDEQIASLAETVKRLDDEKQRKEKAELEQKDIILQLETKIASKNNVKDELIVEAEKQNQFLNEQLENLNILLESNSNKLLALEEEKLQIQSESLKWKNKADCLDCQLKDCSEEIDILKQQIEVLNCDLQDKTEEIRQLNDEKTNLKNEADKITDNNQILITSLQNKSLILSSELNSIKNDKFFLQRLCNDLKLALRSSSNHKQMLMEQITYAQKESTFSSLPSNLPPVPELSQVDEKYINSLLEQVRSFSQSEPLDDIQNSLDALKNEILTLRRQVLKDL